MKLAFSTTLCPDLEFDALIEKSKAWGYDGFELGPLRSQPGADADPAAARRALEQAGQELVSLDSGASLCQRNQHAAGAAAERVRHATTQAQRMGGKFVTVNGLPAAAGRGKVLAAQQNARALSELASEATQQGITLLFHNTEDFSSSQDAWFAQDAAGTPSVRLCVNLANARAAGDPPSVTIPRLVAAARIIRLGDAAFGPNHRVQRYTPCGQGHLGFPMVIALLKGLVYAGWLSVHWPSAAASALPPAEQLLPAAAEFLRSELERPPVPLTAYKGDQTLPRFARPQQQPAPVT
jgi:sugar phosphate isomerase/epimerase